MSQFIATISEIEHCDNLNIIHFNFKNTTLKMMSLELKQDVQVGKTVLLNAKPTNTALAKGIQGLLSLSNQISGKITLIEEGKLLSNIHVKVDDIIFESIITKSSALRMDLKKDDEVSLLIKASELSILKVLS